MENQNIYFKESLPKIPTKEEEKKLLEDIKNPRSKEKLVTKNLRLVVHICKKYQNTGILAEDLFVVGIIGLIKSVNTYVPEKKTRFVTYAAKCIENEILMCLRKEKKWTKLDSFQEIVYQNTSGKTLTIEETLYDESTNGNFEDKMERLDTISKTLTISLNELKSIEKQVLFLYLGGKKQKEIAAKIQKTQSYVSRILINVYNKNQQYSEMKIDEKYEQGKLDGISIGEKRGEQRGRAEGERKRDQDLISSWIKKGKTIAEIAEDLEKSEDYVKSLM